MLRSLCVELNNHLRNVQHDFKQIIVFLLFVSSFIKNKLFQKKSQLSNLQDKILS